MKNFDGLAYAFVFIVIVMSSILIAYLLTLRRFKLPIYKSRSAINRTSLEVIDCYQKKLQLIICHILCLVLGQEQFSSRSTHARIVWFFICCSVFLIVSGYLLNLMSTEMVAEIPLPTLNTVEDLFSDTFKNVKVVLSDILPAYNYIHNSKATTLAALAQLIEKNNNSLDISKTSILTVDDTIVSRSSQYISRALDVIEYQGSALVLEKLTKTRSVYMTQCQVHPQYIEKCHESATFAEGIISFPVNHHIDSNIKYYLDQAMKAIIEFGLKEYLGDKLSNTLFLSMGMQTDTFQTIKCMNPVKEEQEKVFQMKLESLEQVIKWCLIGTFISCVIQFLSLSSLIISKSKNIRKKTNNRVSVQRNVAWL